MAAGWDGGAPAQVALARALYDDRHHSVAEMYPTLGIARAPRYRAVAAECRSSQERGQTARH